jgi:hypothetical protein
VICAGCSGFAARVNAPKLTPPLTNTAEYHGGMADAANRDSLTAAAEIVDR